MIELTLGAQQRLDSYFAELRRVLVDDGKADPGDVERDIRDHIQTALADAGGPVDESRLDQVLRSLGAPSEWIDHPDRPWFARPPKEWLNSAKNTVAEQVHRFAAGPESYRLPYLSLLTLVLGLMLAFLSGDGEGGLAIFAVAVLGAFVLARAAIAIQPEQGLSPAQTWLLSPALLMVYVPLLIVLVAWPMVVGGILINESYAAPIVQLRNAEAERDALLAWQAAKTRAGQEFNQGSAHLLARREDEVRQIKGQHQDLLSVLPIPTLIVLVWWGLLVVISLSMPKTLLAVFAPFSLRFVRRSLLSIGVLSVLVSGVILGVFGLRLSQ